MAFDKTDELEVARILLRFPILIDHSEARGMFPFSWGSKKKPSMRRPTPLSRWKRPLPFPNSKNIRKITLKRSPKTSQNHHHHHRNPSSRLVDNNRRSSQRKKVKQSCSESSGPFLLPDLNVPLLTGEKEEEEDCTGACESKDGISPRSVSARDEDGRNRCCSAKNLIVRVKFGSDGRNN